MRKRTKEKLRKWGQTPDNIIDFLDLKLAEVSSVTKVPIFMMEGTDRHTDFVKARQLYCYVAYLDKPFPISQREVGMGIYKDHCTVIHSIKTIESYIFSKDSYIIHCLEQLKKADNYSSYTMRYEKFSLKDCIKFKKSLNPIVLQENFY